MYSKTNLIGLLSILVIFSACSTSNQVVSNKRKLHNGHKIELRKKPQNKQSETLTQVGNENKLDKETKAVKPVDYKVAAESTVLASKMNNITELNSQNNATEMAIIEQKSEDSNPINKNFAKTFKSEKQVLKQMKKQAKKSKKSTKSGKSQLVALILVALTGAVGIHRFYLGYIGVGIIQLLTGGGCGIWALIDLIRIITGDLKPIDGDYTEKL